MARRSYELRSLKNALVDYLTIAGWDVPIKDRFPANEEIIIPVGAVHFVRNTKSTLEMGQAKETKAFKRFVQVDVYMESQERSDAFCDDVADFMDEVPVTIVDNKGNVLGSLICFDTNSIALETVPPTLVEPAVLRWRGIVRGTYEAYYM